MPIAPSVMICHQLLNFHSALHCNLSLTRTGLCCFYSINETSTARVTLNRNCINATESSSHNSHISPNSRNNSMKEHTNVPSRGCPRSLVSHRQVCEKSGSSAVCLHIEYMPITQVYPCLGGYLFLKQPAFTHFTYAGEYAKESRHLP